MANPLSGGYNATNYGVTGAGSNLSSLYSSAADQYHPVDSTFFLGATTARYSTTARAAWPGPPGVEAGSIFPSVDAFAGYKRPSAAEEG